jgi:protein arginine kinase activator
MLCDVCKENDVVITLTEIYGDGVRQLRLCERCAAERGVQAFHNTPKPQLGSFLQSVHQQITASQGDAARCSFCSSTLRDFRQTGRLGCAHCYTAFEQSLRDLLRRVHGNSKHVGEPYEGPSDEQMLSVGTAEQLRQRLKRAIETEQFELAATLRDQLRALGVS